MRFAGQTAQGLHFADGKTGAKVRYGSATWEDSAGTRVPVQMAMAGQDIVMTVPGDVVDGARYPAVLDPVIGTETAIDSPIYLASAASQSQPAVASDGTNFLVVWIDGSRNGLFGTRISAAGEPMDKGGIQIGPSTASTPAVDFDGTNYVVVWQDSRATNTDANTGIDIYAARVTSTGVVMDPGGRPVCTVGGDQKNPRLAWNGSQHFVVWEDQRAAGPADIYGTRMSPDLTVLDNTGKVICDLDSAKTKPQIAALGSGFLVAWNDTRSTNAGFYGAHVSGAGVVAESAGFQILPASGVTDPAIAAGDTYYFVAWAQGYSMYGQRLTADGVADGGVVDGTPLVLASSSYTRSGTAVSFAGGSFFALWRINSSNELQGTWVYETDGAVTSPSQSKVVVSSSAPSATPVLAASSANYIIAYNKASTFVTPVSERLIPLAPGSAVGAEIAGSLVANTESTPKVTFDGNRYFVAWADKRAGSGTRDIYGARIDKDGTVLDPTGIAICTDSADQWNVAVGSDPTYFYAVWQDQRSGTSIDIYGARIDKSTGTVVDSAGNFVSKASTDQTEPAIAFDGTNYLVVWADQRNPGVYGARVDPGTGSPLTSDIAGFGIEQSGGSGRAYHPSLAFDGSKYLVVWADNRGSPLNYLRSRVVNPDGSLVGTSSTVLDQLLANGDPASYSVTGTAVASNGDGFLVTYVYDGVFYSSSNPEQHVTQLQGLRLDSAGVLLSEKVKVAGTSLDNYTNEYATLDAPAVVWNGQQYVVAYRDLLKDRLSAAWVLTSGTSPLVVTPMAAANIGTGIGSGPALASDGTSRTFLTYSRTENAPPYGAERAWMRFIEILPSDFIVPDAGTDALPAGPDTAVSGTDAKDLASGIDSPSSLSDARVPDSRTVDAGSDSGSVSDVLASIDARVTNDTSPTLQDAPAPAKDVSLSPDIARTDTPTAPTSDAAVASADSKPSADAAKPSADATGTTGKSSGCSCNIGGRQDMGYGWILGLTLLVGLAIRVRRRG
jgi:hypothetical protein